MMTALPRARMRVGFAAAAALLAAAACSNKSSETAAPATPPAEPLPAGAAAPDFTADAHDGTTVTLSALKGKPVVLYFYPKDETPG